MAQVFNLVLSPAQAEATLSALEHEVESCVKADLRDRQSFGFGPVIHEDSAMTRSYLSARKFAAESTLLAMQEAGVPYAAESLQRARGAYDRVWGAFRHEQEESALHVRLDGDSVLNEALLLAAVALGQVKVRKSANGHASFVTLDANVTAVLRKANEKAPGWAKEVPALASHAQNLARALPMSSANTVFKIGTDLENAYRDARKSAKVVA